MNIALLITAAPGSAASERALAFAETAINAGHEITRVFFMNAGAEHGRSPGNWRSLKENNLELIICAGSAQRHNITQNDVLKPFEIAGLGQLVDAEINSDRVVTFG